MSCQLQGLSEQDVSAIRRVLLESDTEEETAQAANNGGAATPPPIPTTPPRGSDGHATPVMPAWAAP